MIKITIRVRLFTKGGGIIADAPSPAGIFQDGKQFRDWSSLIGMKSTDDVQAKIRLWVAAAAQPGFRPPPCPVMEKLPPFPPQRFSSYAQLNEWKHWYLLEIARQGGVKWKRSSRS